MILLGLIFNFCGTLALLFAHPSFNFVKSYGAINVENLKSEKTQKIP
jgi:hypothetical protein